MKEQENYKNVNSLEISPMIWNEAINRSVGLTHEYSKVLLPNSDFKKWLQEGEIEHNSLNISSEVPSVGAAMDEFARAIENNYFYKVSFIDKYKIEHVKPTLEDLEKLPSYNEDLNLIYYFKVKDLDHLVSLYFQHWLIFNSYFYWVKWQLYLDFIIRKSEKMLGGLYEYKWAMTLGHIDRYSHAFDRVDQYKIFRDKLEDMSVKSKFVENEFIKIRDSKHKRKNK